MKIIAVIPARWQSSRFPGKPLVLLKGKYIIQHVYERVLTSGIFAEVIVATDDERILKAVEEFGGTAEMTSIDLRSGTDRVAEVCRKHDFEIVVNVQGDEPFITKAPLQKLVSAFDDPQVQTATLMNRILDNIDDPNQVKVVFDKNHNALYFSRAAIPFERDNEHKAEFWGHIGVYAFRKEMLENFVKLPQSRLENLEKLEQLRLLENGYSIRMVATEYQGWGIDTQEDLIKAINN
ncbi:MAG: 3-deoxy-manno-octulosonate cytidylyltransferase [Candidatus Cloacimonetes bacterium]|nr:3-deoxy-manno-octulosonate cytidylyltransferase [Candidatus Cloacimonadota bacterium]